ncbi:MAG: nitronate monooxygenase [Deltaproteobacteria bacterium]|nr:nitronate monooxygenase [Deltaproteobacteria bacterium]
MSRPNPLKTRFTELVGVDYPIVQTGMGWVSGARLTAATANAGGLGILASATMTYEELESSIAAVKSRTSRPFGVNMRADQADVMKRVDLLIEQGVALASFAAAPNKEVIGRLKAGGIKCMPTIAAKRHAQKVEDWGVDAVICQGAEGGGHTGSIATSVLLPQVCAAVKIPVLAAGGFSNGRGLAAALAYGADGVAMGTRFLMSQESTVPEAVKGAYLKTDPNGTVVTTAVDGYPQRVVRTPFIDSLEKSSPIFRLFAALGHAVALRRQTGDGWVALIREALAMKREQELTWSQVALAPSAPMLTKFALVDGRVEAGILPTGQVAGTIEQLLSVEQIIDEVIRDARTQLAVAAALAAAHTGERP